MITMEIATINQYIMKIIIAAREQDSINQIAKRINISYGWTHKWCRKLINLGVFKEVGLKLILNKEGLPEYFSTPKIFRESIMTLLLFNLLIYGKHAF